jgi:hypothetical protein
MADERSWEGWTVMTRISALPASRGRYKDSRPGKSGRKLSLSVGFPVGGAIPVCRCVYAVVDHVETSYITETRMWSRGRSKVKCCFCGSQKTTATARVSAYSSSYCHCMTAPGSRHVQTWSSIGLQVSSCSASFGLHTSSTWPRLRTACRCSVGRKVICVKKNDSGYRFYFERR